MLSVGLVDLRTNGRPIAVWGLDGASVLGPMATDGATPGGAIDAASSAEHALQAVMPPERVREIVAEEVAAAAPAVGLRFVPAKGSPDTRFVVEVRRYAIEADGEDRPATATVQLAGTLTYLPEMKVVWEGAARADVPLRRELVGNPAMPGTGDLRNVLALSKVDQHEVLRLFLCATRGATRRLMRELAADYRQGKADDEYEHGTDEPSPAEEPPAE
jgi:hypothetical protein